METTIDSETRLNHFLKSTCHSWHQVGVVLRLQLQNKCQFSVRSLMRKLNQNPAKSKEVTETLYFRCFQWTKAHYSKGFLYPYLAQTARSSNCLPRLLLLNPFKKIQESQLALKQSLQKRLQELQEIEKSV